MFLNEIYCVHQCLGECWEEICKPRLKVIKETRNHLSSFLYKKVTLFFMMYSELLVFYIISYWLFVCLTYSVVKKSVHVDALLESELI